MVESRHIDRKIDKDANREDMLAKFIFTLVYFFVKEFGENLDYCVFIDSPDGEECSSVALQCMLNNRCSSELGFENRPFKQVTYVRSENSRLIQAVDLLTGAVAYETNGLHRATSASKHRQRLWANMLAASTLSSFATPTKFWPKEFQIQHFDFGKPSSRALLVRSGSFLIHRNQTNVRSKPSNPATLTGLPSVRGPRARRHPRYSSPAGLFPLL